MITLKNGAYLVGGQIVDDYPLDKKQAKKGTITYKILAKHNVSVDENKLKIKFDALVGHDITYVGIIQTARASGLERFPLPFALTNCHNSLSAVGGTINEDDHAFGLSAAKKYGGIFVPPCEAVIHQYARERLAKCQSMILGSDSHTRYGALGTMAIGEGGPELVKQLLGNTYDIDYPEVVCVRLSGKPKKGVGPHDVAIALIGEVFKNAFVKNRVLEFVGDGIKNLSIDYRNGIDVMTTETACLSSIWQTDEVVREYYKTHLRESDFSYLTPDNVAYYDKIIDIDLSDVQPMIALPFHPSNAFTIREFLANAKDILAKIDENAKTLFPSAHLDLLSKVNGKTVRVDQGIIAGCAGGTFENICVSSDILKGKSIGSDAFSLSIYPASTPIQSELWSNGKALSLLESGAIFKPAFCGPCFGAGDTPKNNGFSIRHTTRNFPNREGSKPSAGQISAVALMDARSISATAVSGGIITPADEIDFVETRTNYRYNPNLYRNRVYDGFERPDKNQSLEFGPNITDWPTIPKAKKQLLMRFTAVIHDEVTTTDELIPSGETSSLRSNPLKLAEYTLSRRVPSYVSSCKKLTEEIEENSEELQRIKRVFGVDENDCNIGSIIFANKPGDGSAREQASSCQRVLGGSANFCKEFATKRYRSNVINWGMLPLTTKEEVDIKTGGYAFVEDVYSLIDNEKGVLLLYSNGKLSKVSVETGLLTDEEKEILKCGCLMNYYKKQNTDKKA